MSEEQAVEKFPARESSIPLATPWLTPEEAAAYARRKKSTIYKWISTRAIASYTPDGKVLLNKKDLDLFIATHKRPALVAAKKRK
jgi:excisionase family DNA binding protein